MSDIKAVEVPSTGEILSRGMNCLVNGMGIINAEYFISAVKRERFDYTKWQREYFKGATLKEFVDDAVRSVEGNR